MTFHSNQINTADDIVSTMMEGWVFYMILLAQMQSGKTGTYLKVAFDSVLKGVVDNVLIISGSRDTSLRGQAKVDLKNNIEEYSKEKAKSIDEYLTMIRSLTNSISIYWSQELKQINELMPRTLIIHEESHAAQSKNNKPYIDFYKKHNIEKALYGDLDTVNILKENEIWILNVSATPFSEIISNFSADDNNLFNKKIFFAHPGDSYIGINTLLDQGKIIFNAKPITEESTSDIETVLINNYEKYKAKYCIIRTKCAHKDKDMMQLVAAVCKYDYINVFATDKNSKASDALKFLENKPNNNTIVHICGKARMGQVLYKDHIAMVYEQSSNPNTDTILQGLLGRMCGYYSTEIPEIYISDKKENEINIYANAWSNSNITKFEEIEKATNLQSRFKRQPSYIKVDKDGQDWIQIHPIELFPENFNDFIVEDDEFDYNSKIMEDINVESLNLTGNVDGETIKNIISDKTKCHKRSNICSKMYRSKYEELGGYLGYIEKCIEDNERCNPVTLFPEKSSTDEFRSLQMLGGFDENDSYNPLKKIFIVGYVKYNPEIHPAKISIRPIVKEKANYVNSVVNEDGTVIENVNGGQIIRFPFETTSDSLTCFETKLRESIKRTLPEDPTYIENCCRSINSIYCNGKKEYVGIYIKMSLVKGGVLKKMEKRLNDEFSLINLKFPGFVKTDMPGYRRMVSVTW